MRHRGRPAEEVHRRLREFARAVGAHHHDCAGTVRDEAAIAHRERVADHARGAYLRYRQRIAHESLGVEARPAARRYRDLSQLFGGGAVLVHVARGRQRERPGHVARLVVDLERRCVREVRRALRRALVRAVADQCHIAEARFKREGRGERELEEGASAYVGAYSVARMQAKIVCRRQHRQEVDRVRGEKAVDAGKREPRVGQCRVHRLAEQFEVGVARRFAEAGEPGADDGRAAA